MANPANITAMDLLGLLFLLLLGLITGWTLLVGYTVWMLACPPRRSYAWAVARSFPGDPSELRILGQPTDQLISFDSWSFRSRGLDLPVWDIRGLDPNGPVVILTHGWADSRVTMLASGRVATLLPRTSRLVLWDLPGHGDAPGRCELGIRETADLATLIAHVAADDSTRPLVLHGFSLGAVVALNSAAAAPVAAVIAEAPYIAPWTPARNTLRLRGLPYLATLPPAITLFGALRGQGLGWWPRTAAPADHLSRLHSRPTLILHGEIDAITPAEDGRAIADSIPGSRFVMLRGGDHVSLFADPATQVVCDRELAAFFDSLR